MAGDFAWFVSLDQRLINSMKRFLFQSAVLTSALLIAAAVYAVLIDRDSRYDIFDLIEGRPVAAAIGVDDGLLAQTGGEGSLLRAVPLDLNGTDVLEKVNLALADLTDAVVPSVVSIDTSRIKNVVTAVPTDPWGFGYRRQNQSFREPGLGSGVIITEEGHIVTNHHVVAGVDEILVTTHDGSQYPAEWVGSEPNVDVAVLKIKAPEGATLPKFRPLGFGDSEKVRVGEMVMAVGNPFGLSESVTRGIISAKQRELSDAANEYFQVDAVINPGNSGGPLVNARGEIIGINVAIFTGQQNVQVWQGIGLAIPANEVREVFEAIVLGRPLIRGYFGLELENISRNYALAVGLRSLNGAVITSVVEGSPAEAAGLLPGDVITKLDSKAMQSAEDALSRIRLMKSDETAKVTIIRKGKPMETEVTAMAKSDTNTLRLKSDILTTGQSIVDAIGIKVRDLTVIERNSMGVGPEYPAILVSKVVDGSQAERRFRNGDLIHQINRSPVSDVASFYDLMGSLPTDSATVITLSRQGKIIQAILK